MTGVGPGLAHSSHEAQSIETREGLEVAAHNGPLKGQRVVRGREGEYLAHYRAAV